MLSNIRASVDTADPTLTAGYQSLQDLGVSTGASNGSTNASATDGLLTVDTATLTAAIQNNPSAVQAALASWSSQYQKVVNNASGPFGSIETRISGNNTEISSLQGQLDDARPRCSTTRRRPCRNSGPRSRRRSRNPGQPEDIALQLRERIAVVLVLVVGRLGADASDGVPAVRRFSVSRSSAWP